MERYRLYLGNSIEIMKGMEDQSIDVLFADPPYGNNTDYASYEDTQENLEKLVKAFMPEALRIAKRVVLTPGNGNQWLYPKPSWTMAFVNAAGTGRSAWGFSCWQPILVYGKDPYLSTGQGCRPDTLIMRNSGDIDNDVDHPCPKPNNVMRWIIERTSLPGDTVYDPFMGTGTTGKACMQLGDRYFIGSELEAGYFEIAKAKIAEAAQQAVAVPVMVFKSEQMSMEDVL
jgi:DNA modification methylase